MTDRKTPFEIHITVETLNVERETEFIGFCRDHQAKPLLIELAKGQFTSQPMLSKTIYSEDFEEILVEANSLSTALKSSQFEIKRLKIEVPSENAALFDALETVFEKYYEWHGKVNYIHTEKLIELCEAHQVHLSLNALKAEDNSRFITLREFGSKTRFESRISDLTESLNNGKWTIDKSQSEYCIYDNNNFLDAGWLPQ